MPFATADDMSTAETLTKRRYRQDQADRERQPEKDKPRRSGVCILRRLAAQQLAATGLAGPGKNNGRSLTPNMLPAKAATSHSQPCRLPEAMPLK